MTTYYKCTHCDLIEKRSESELKLICPNDSEHGEMQEIEPGEDD